MREPGVAARAALHSPLRSCRLCGVGASAGGHAARMRRKERPMAATIHPDLELHLSLEKDHYEGDIESETERRFSELAPTEVERARASSQHEDVLEFSVGKDAADESRDPVWHLSLIHI